MSYLIARPVDVNLEFGRAEEGRLMSIGFPRGLHISSGGERQCIMPFTFSRVRIGYICDKSLELDEWREMPRAVRSRHLCNRE